MARNNLPPGPGRPKGLPNKATQEARAAIGMFVDQNAHRLQEWLDRLAEGVKDDEGKYIIPPNPEKAASLFTGIIEYHVPKLARSEVQPLDKDGKPADNKLVVEFVNKNPDSQ
jgi:hypothetical protein